MNYTILVPQGAEYQAVCRGLSKTGSPQPQVLPIPIGYQPVTHYLEKWQKSEQFLTDTRPQVLLMGLAGSLSPQYNIGDIVLYQNSIWVSNQSEPSLPGSDRKLQLNSQTLPSAISTDSTLTTLVHHHLQEKTYLVKGLTSDRLIWSSLEKQQLSQLYQAGVVDMEGYAVLKVLNSKEVAVAMLRVISDDCYYDLPDLNCAFSPDGALKALPLAIGMIRQPLAATRLIRGSLKGLRVLQEVTADLFRVC
ncbi:MAG: phosphorylase [Symploca sp. SIO2C1]|nr:phosphorylase [Symploca sp. SIO2C1]